MSDHNFLIVVAGPTAVGKTAFCVRLGQQLGCDVISADSRQFFKEMSVGTAKPTFIDLKGVPHHFLDFLSIEEEMSAGSFEMLALEKLEELFVRRNVAILTGGSGLYIKAVCEGMSDMPAPPPGIRDELMQTFEMEGLEKLLEELKEKDRDYYEKVDRSNHQRVVRALEMIRFTGEPFSSYRSGFKADRDFSMIKIGLEMDREMLYDRINRRVDQMLAAGLVEEVKSLYEKRYFNALQTVGYKEFFDFLEGKHDFEEAVRLVKRNTRRYAKRQMTWFKKDSGFHWFRPDQFEAVVEFLKERINYL